MTLYIVVYVSYGTTNTSQVFGTLTQAESAFDWFQTLDGTTSVQLISWSGTVVDSWTA